MVSSRVLDLGRLFAHLLAGLFKSRRELVLENLALRHQLGVALRTNPHPRIHRSDRILWVTVSRLWAGDWRDHLVFVKPATVVGWHRRGWRLYWTWRSRSHAERWITSCRRECLDWMLIASEGHLRRVLREYVDHYNDERPHRSRNLRPPSSRVDLTSRPEGDTITRRARLGGLISEYYLEPIAA